MKKSVIGIYSNGNFIEGVPYIYTGTKWEHARPHIYSSGWKTIGGAGTLCYNFLEKNGLYYNSTEQILVRSIDYVTLLDSNNEKIQTSNEMNLVIEEE